MRTGGGGCRDLRPCPTAHGVRSTGTVPVPGEHIVAALDGAPNEAAVRRVADVMGGLLDIPVRPVHVVSGPGLRGAARASALAKVERGESAKVTGRPEAVLATLTEAPSAALTVIGTSQRGWRPRARRAAGTAMALARRVSRPLLMVPPSATGWTGPRRVLTLLDGTGDTAVAAASALSSIRVPETVSRSLHVNGSAPAERAVGRLPADAVIEESKASDSDLVVIVWGRTARGPKGAMILDVLSRTSVPVLLVPLPTAASEG